MDVFDIILMVTQIAMPIVILVYSLLLRKRLRGINKMNREIMNDYIERNHEIAMSEFLRVNPDIQPEIFEEKKEPIVPSKEKVRHHFNHKGGDYFI